MPPLPHALIPAAHCSPAAQRQQRTDTAMERGEEWREETLYLEKDWLISHPSLLPSALRALQASPKIEPQSVPPPGDNPCYKHVRA